MSLSVGQCVIPVVARSRLTDAAEVVARVQRHVVFLRKLPDRIRRTTLRLRTLDPVRAHLDHPPVSVHPKLVAHQSSAQLRAGLNDYEVVDALLVQGARGDDSCDTAAENEHLGVLPAIAMGG